MRHHLSMAHGSLCELETHMLIASRLGYLGPDDTRKFEQHAGEVGRLIRGVMLRIDRNRENRGFG